MSYTHGKREAVFRIATGEKEIPLQTAAVKATMQPGLQPIEVTGFWVLVTTVGSATAAKLELNHRTAPGVTSGETAIATVTFPTAAFPVGSVVYQRIDGVKVMPGEELAVELLTANTSGVGVCGIEYNETTENPANLSNVHATVNA